MNGSRGIALGLGLAVALVADLAAPARAGTTLGTAFTYQGQLNKDGAPVEGACDFQFSLWDDATGGGQVGSMVPKDNVAVTNGLFTVGLDFGQGAFDGNARWLKIAARSPAGAGGFTDLSPRQPLTPSPYALALPGLRTEQNPTSPNVIGGHSGNTVTAGVYGAAIAGGGDSTFTNRVTDDYGAVGGGAYNQAGDNAGTTSDAPYATVAGGDNNTASGRGATVPGGAQCSAGGYYSFATGYRARANNRGSFAWADNSTANYFDVSVNYRFGVRATGGVYLYTRFDLSTGSYLAANSGSWASVSDRNVKDDIQEVAPREVLEKLTALPVSTWRYKGEDESIRHMGPMAQDLHAAFGLGDSEKSITTIDADGISFAAIQGLHQLVQEKDAEIAELKQRLDRLEALVRNVGKE